MFWSRNLRPYDGSVGDIFIFMNVNVLPYQVRLANKYLANQYLERMDWPPRFLDLNVIGCIWN